MAAVPITISATNQKITRNTQVAAQEDAWTITGMNGSFTQVLVIRPSQDTYYHSTSGQTAGDGFAIPAGSFFPIQLGSTTTTFFLRPVSTAGVVDCFVAPATAWTSTGASALVKDGTNALTQGNSQKPTYTISDLNSAPTAANFVMATFESGASKVSRLRRLIITNPGLGTAAAGLQLELIRTTAASSVGTTQTPASHDANDGAFSGVARIAGPTITAGTRIWSGVIYQPATSLAQYSPAIFEFYGQMSKAILIPSGVTNGLALRCVNGNAGATGFAFSMELSEETV